ncbi:MAG TPA: hypothetical protein VIM00_10140 [Candidatus Acidoferrum sp.]|jgi:hypothetical protein
MRKTTLHQLFCAAFCVSSTAGSAAARSPHSADEVRSIILRSKHLGAHGMGYGDRSLNELAHQLTPEDVPVLIDLLADQHLRTGVSFALASQCAASIEPTHDAAVEHKLQFYEAQEVLDLITGFAGCSANAKEKAGAMRSELTALGDADLAKSSARAKLEAENDARIQRNGLKMLDPKQAATLTREEREEVYHRSLKAMGLDENGPLTSQQRDLVNRMYRTMVLGEPGQPKPQQQ